MIEVKIVEKPVTEVQVKEAERIGVNVPPVSGLIKGRDGYSPYIGENGTWIYWNDESREWVDTGVKAEGKTPEKGVDYFTEAERQEVVNEAIQGFVDIGLDTTLKAANRPAQAKAVGDALNKLAAEFAKETDKLESEKADKSEIPAPYDDSGVKSSILALQKGKADKSEIPPPYDDTAIKQQVKELNDNKADKADIPAPYDDSGVRAEIKSLGETKADKSEIPAPYDDTQIRQSISGLEESKADKSEIPAPYDDSSLKASIKTLESNKADKSEIPEVDSTLAKSGAAADAGAVGDQLTQIAMTFGQMGSSITAANQTAAAAINEAQKRMSKYPSEWPDWREEQKITALQKLGILPGEEVGF